VITGLSGSGKSSLAFDTIYAEGVTSSYARQFLELVRKRDVDSIDGLSPAISIERKTTSKNPRQLGDIGSFSCSAHGEQVGDTQDGRGQPCQPHPSFTQLSVYSRPRRNRVVGPAHDVARFRRNIPRMKEMLPLIEPLIPALRRSEIAEALIAQAGDLATAHPC